MNFKNWLYESVDPLTALKEKAENGFDVKTKFGTFKFSEMDGKKFVLVVDDETAEKEYKAIVTAKKNEDDKLSISVSVFDGDELVGKMKADNPDEDDVSYAKLDSCKAAMKDMKDTIESIIKGAEEIELEESLAIATLVSGLAPLIGLAIPSIYKIAVEKNYFGLGDDKSSTPAPKPDDLLNRFREMPRKQIVELLKDSDKMDAFVNDIIAEMKKAAPRLIINPKTKGEIYNKIEKNLRNVIHAEDKRESGTAMAPIRDAAKEVMSRSVGSKHGGLYLGKTY